MRRVVFVVGPTASGKTSLSIELALARGGEIINADSVQVYRGFDIGSCKPTPEEQARVRHHLVDILEPHETFDAGRFVQLADAAIEQISAAGHLPIIVGGTGLYFRALLHGLAKLPPVAPEVRREVQEELEAVGVETLHRRLAEVDHEAAERIAPKDRQRITRALEVYRMTGTPLSAHQARHGFAPRRYAAEVLAPDRPRRELYRRIDTRVDGLFAGGFPQEVRRLLAAGVAPDCRPMRSLGYARVVEALEGQISMQEAAELTKRDHRHYAKRQLTWFRKVPDINWLPPEGNPESKKLSVK